MCDPRTSGRVCVPGQRVRWRSFKRQSLVFSPKGKLERGKLVADHDSTSKGFASTALQGFNALTLSELLIVVGIVSVLLGLIRPAFISAKGGTDVTNAAYTIKGVLKAARTYAKTSNMYTWVAFYEEDVSQSLTNPAPGHRQILTRVAYEPPDMPN